MSWPPEPNSRIHVLSSRSTTLQSTGLVGSTMVVPASWSEYSRGDVRRLRVGNRQHDELAGNLFRGVDRPLPDELVGELQRLADMGADEVPSAHNQLPSGHDEVTSGQGRPRP